MNGEDLVDVLAALRGRRYRFANEGELQAGMAKVLDEIEARYEREVWLSNDLRIDFVVDGKYGLEVKIKGSFGMVERQLMLYAARPELAQLVLVTTSRRLAIEAARSFRGVACGKPMHVVDLGLF